MLSSIEVSDWYRTIIIGRLFWNQCYVFTLVLVKQLPRDSVSLSDCRYDELRLLLMIFIVGCYPLQGILLCPIYIYIFRRSLLFSRVMFQFSMRFSTSRRFLLSLWKITLAKLQCPFVAYVLSHLCILIRAATHLRDTTAMPQVSYCQCCSGLSQHFTHISNSRSAMRISLDPQPHAYHPGPFPLLQLLSQLKYLRRCISYISTWFIHGGVYSRQLLISCQSVSPLLNRSSMQSGILS